MTTRAGRVQTTDHNATTEHCRHEYQPGHRDGWCSFPPGHPPIARSDTFYQHGNEQTGYYWNNLFPAPCKNPADHEPHITTLGKWCDGLTARRVRSAGPELHQAVKA